VEQDAGHIKGQWTYLTLSTTSWAMHVCTVNSTKVKASHNKLTECAIANCVTKYYISGVVLQKKLLEGLIYPFNPI